LSERGTYHGALRFPNAENATPRPLQLFDTMAQGVLEDFGHDVLDRTLEADNRVWISAVDFDLTLHQDAHRVSIDLCPTGAACGDEETAHMLLSVMLYRMASDSDAAHVEWLSTKLRLPVGEFMTSFDPAQRPTIVETVHPIFSPVEETACELDLVCDRLAARSIEVEPVMIEQGTERKDLSERIICWGMTFFAGLIFAPIAIAMAFANVIRGEDFRRNAHALTMTFALIALTSGGALAGAFQLLAP
jgi:hypothetical protein